MRFLARAIAFVMDALASDHASEASTDDAPHDDDRTTPVTPITAPPDWKALKIRNDKGLRGNDMVWLLAVIIISVATKVDSGMANIVALDISAYVMTAHSRS